MLLVRVGGEGVSAAAGFDRVIYDPSPDTAGNARVNRAARSRRDAQTRFKSPMRSEPHIQSVWLSQSETREPVKTSVHLDITSQKRGNYPSVTACHISATNLILINVM